MCWLVILGLLMGWLSPSEESDMDGERDRPRDIPETPVDSDAYMETSNISGDIPVLDTYDWDAGFTLKIPGFYRRLLAVKEAERIVNRR